MDQGDMVTIAGLIHRAVTETDGDPDHATAKEIRAQVSELVASHPAYPRS
jgi:glycine hydroxymethyltransferase